VTLEERVEKLEKRQDIAEASEAKWQRVVDEQLTDLTNIILSLSSMMRKWNNDLAEHFKKHYIDKKERPTPKRKSKY